MSYIYALYFIEQKSILYGSNTSIKEALLNNIVI